MNLFEKLETLFSATARAPFPRRNRRSVLDEQEERLLAEVRQALAEVEAQERVLADRVKAEHAQADDAAHRGDRAAQRAHERRAAELERQLEQESIQAINIEAKLQALEEKLALAKEAVEKEQRDVAQRDADAEAVMQQGGLSTSTSASAPAPPSSAPAAGDDFVDDDPDVAARKSRLSG